MSTKSAIAAKSTIDVVLVDAGGSNIGSLRYALQRLNVDAQLSADARRIRTASHVILPGVGAAAPGMQRLHDAGLTDTIRGLTQPVLGVCLGMQLLFERSEEGDTPCLGLIAGTVQRFPRRAGLRIPHMGWNTLTVKHNNDLLAAVPADTWVYFVHSYAAPIGAYTLASSDYGSAFSAAVRQENFFGVQFHPERSGAAGARMLGNFLGLRA